MYVLELGGQDDDFAVFEAESAASDVTSIAPGLATARGLTERVESLAYTRAASELLGRCPPDVESARALLEATALQRTGSVAVRAEDVRGKTGVDTQRAERVLGQVLVDRGFAVDLDNPDHELRVLFGGEGERSGTGQDDDGQQPGTCAVGWLVAESVRDFGERKPTDRPYFQPGSMDPLLARALANVAGARPGATVLDPMCGTGGILIEAGLVGARVIGTDAQGKMVEGARENLAAFLDGDWHVARADACSLPVCDGGVDAVVFDAPYGRQSKVEGDIDGLLSAALREARRVASRCIVVGDRPWARTASAAGWTTEAAFQRPVHRSLTRYVLALRR